MSCWDLGAICWGLERSPRRSARQGAHHMDRALGVDLRWLRPVQRTYTDTVSCLFQGGVTHILRKQILNEACSGLF